MRITVFCFTCLVTLFSFFTKLPIYQMVENAYKVTLVSAFVPLLCGVYWRRATNQGALMAIFFGLAAWLGLLLVGEEDPFVPAQFAGLVASFAGMVAGSLMPQFVYHNPEIHDELRFGHHLHPAAATYHVPGHPAHHGPAAQSTEHGKHGA